MKRNMLKKLILSVLLIFVMSMLFGCYNNDDFAPYERYSKTVNFPISTETNSLTDILPQIDEFAEEQQSGLTLTKIVMTFSGLDECETEKGKIIFSYEKEHQDINQVSKMDIYFDMQNSVVEKFTWEKGHSKRVVSFGGEIENEFLSLPFSEIFAHFNQDNEYIEKLKEIDPRLKIEMSNNRLSAYLYDGDEPGSNPVFRYNSAD
jgi:hypothetical protein